MLYFASTLGVAGFVFLLLALERAVRVPPRIRAWMSPRASPAFALAGCVIGLPVALVLLLPVLGNEAAQTVVWGGVYSSVIVVVGFLTALGVLIRLTWVWLDGRDTKSIATTHGRIGGTELR